MISTIGTAPNRNIDQIQLVLNLFKCPSPGDSATLSSSRCSGTGNDFQYRAVGAAVANYLGNGGTLLTDGGWSVRSDGLCHCAVNEGGQAGSANPGTLEVQISSQTAGAGFWITAACCSKIAGSRSPTSPTEPRTRLSIAEHYRCDLLDGWRHRQHQLQFRQHGLLLRLLGQCRRLSAAARGVTVASDVCFSSVIGVNGNANARVGGNGDISSQHEAGAQIALCDGSVRYFSSSTDNGLLTNLCNRRDQTMISLPQN